MSGALETLLAIVSSVGGAAIWKSVADVGRIMISAAGFILFLIIGTIGTLFMPPKNKSK